MVAFGAIRQPIKEVLANDTERHVPAEYIGSVAGIFLRIVPLVMRGLFILGSVRGARGRYPVAVLVKSTMCFGKVLHGNIYSLSKWSGRSYAELNSLNNDRGSS